MTDRTLVLAHYYTTPEVQRMADHVGDSLDLALHAQREKADRIVFCGVRFMAETAKILNPEAEVILPDVGSTCSLVEQTDIEALQAWVRHARARSTEKEGKLVAHVAYINSSAEHKATADIIVTSRIVDDVIKQLHEQGKKVLFSPDRNMGEYLNYQYGYGMQVWSAVCEVHDKFKAEEIEKLWEQVTNGPKYLLAHPESPLPVLKRADYIGSTHGMLNWVKELKERVATIYVATEEGLLYNMRALRPELDIRQAPTYTGCQCNQCPYMKLNTKSRVSAAVRGVGEKIDYLTEMQVDLARRPIERMLRFQETGKVELL